MVLQVLVKVTSTFHLFASRLCQTQLKLLSRCSCVDRRDLPSPWNDRHHWWCSRYQSRLKNLIKMIWNYAGNCIINQHSNASTKHTRSFKTIPRVKWLVMVDNHMTSSAKYADIILPDLTTSEQDDWCMDGKAANMPYFIFAQKAIEPQFEAKSIYEMCSQLAKRMGVEKSSQKAVLKSNGLNTFTLKLVRTINLLPAFEEMKELGIYKRRSYDHHYIAYEDFRKDPEANPLTTPSGKIESTQSNWLISRRLEVKRSGDSPSSDLRRFFWRPQRPINEKYPLQLTGFPLQGSHPLDIRQRCRN